MSRVAIVGSGLIGGSFALALRSRNAVDYVLAVDTRAVVASASVVALSDERIAIDDRRALATALSSVDLVLLAAPISAIRRELGFLLEHAALVTDCGSTKRTIVAEASASAFRPRFVAGHPMAGGSAAGAEHADPKLFEGRRWILCPEGSDARAVASVEAWIRKVGATVVHMDAVEHDRAAAMASHVPQLVASAIAAANEHVDPRTRGPGFASTTRIAGGNPDIWQDIFETNADQIAWALRQMGQRFEAVAAALEQDPPDVGPARSLLEAARRVRRP